MYPTKLEEMIQGRTLHLTSMQRVEHANPTFIPIELTGGIGDALLSITTLNHLHRLGYTFVVYSQHANALGFFYKGVVHRGPMSNYTWHLKMDSVCKFSFTDQFNGFLLPEHKALFDGQQELFRQNPTLELLVKQHPEHKYLLIRHAKELGLRVSRFSAYTLGLTDVEEAKPLPRNTTENYITIHDGFDTNSAHMVQGSSTKQWPLQNWAELVSLIRAHYPDMGIIQLGSKTARIINGVTKNLVNKTTLHEAFDVLSKSKLHIDTCSGLAHAATFLSVPSVVMFGPTSKHFYGHLGNVNLDAKDSCSGGCMHISKDWMNKCPVGYSVPVCMYDITAGLVFDYVQALLK